MRTLITNIAQLVVVPPGPVRGTAMKSVPIIPAAALVIEDGKIAWLGPESAAPSASFDEKVDAAGATVVPGLVDCHTHAVFAGSRANEFVQKIEGRTYLEILEAGGGIRSTMAAVRAATIEQLIAESRPRLERMIESGATTIEIKSGYGLSPDDEIKMLRAARRLADDVPVDIVTTYLGAHTIPPEFDGRADAYVDLMTADALLARIRKERLAEFADVFTERGAFTVDQSRQFLARCAKSGLKPKIHAEQLSLTGATRMAVELGATSADHLEFADDATIESLRASHTIPVLLPGCSFFLHTAPAPARKLIAADLPVALATDCNPGSCMIESLPLVMSIAATMLRMTPIECLVASTANAAAALGRADRIGAIAVGHEADLLFLDISDVNQWVYRVGVNPVTHILKRGRMILGREVSHSGLMQRPIWYPANSR